MKKAVKKLSSVKKIVKKSSNIKKYKDGGKAIKLNIQKEKENKSPKLNIYGDKEFLGGTYTQPIKNKFSISTGIGSTTKKFQPEFSVGISKTFGKPKKKR